MEEKKGGSLYTAGKLAEELGISQGKVQKMIAASGIKPDEVKKGCKYYGPAALKKLKAEVKKA